MHDEAQGRFVDVWDTRLWVVERGPSNGYPVVVLHGGPGLDHHEFGDYLDPLTDRYRLLLVDQRAQGRSEKAPRNTWTLEQMAHDVLSLAKALGLERYCVYGHSYGAFVALQNAVDFPGQAAQTVVSSGVPSARFLEEGERLLESIEPPEIRDRIAWSFDREAEVETSLEFDELMRAQMPFHFADPLDPGIEEYIRRTEGTLYAPDLLREFAEQGYGGIEVESRLSEIPQPVLVITGRHERTCPVEGSEAIARGARHAELVILENSAHMSFAEEQDPYLAALRRFLDGAAG